MKHEKRNDEDPIVILNDQDGNEVAFMFLDYIQYLDDKYVVLLPEDGESLQVCILKEAKELEENGDRQYSEVDEDEEEAVFKIFTSKFYDEFDWAREE